jgi:hypothetical protein
MHDDVDRLAPPTHLGARTRHVDERVGELLRLRVPGGEPVAHGQDSDALHAVGAAAPRERQAAQRSGERPHRSVGLDVGKHRVEDVGDTHGIARTSDLDLHGGQRRLVSGAGE